jgi:hypothetical protein
MVPYSPAAAFAADRDGRVHWPRCAVKKGGVTMHHVAWGERV